MNNYTNDVYILGIFLTNKLLKFIKSIFFVKENFLKIINISIFNN